MANISVTLRIDEEKANKIVEFYQDCKVDNDGEYIFFHAKTIDNVAVTIYFSSRGYKVIFMGKKAVEEAQIWDSNAVANTPKEKIKSEWKDLYDQIGSDEVGTGDFFGPVIVVASYTSKQTIKLLKDLGVDDSKKMTDEKILEIVPQILDKVVYSKLTCSTEKYNEMYEKGENINSIKAILHNEALQNVRSKIHDQNVKCYIDQFCEPVTYYRYLQGKYDAIFNNIHFETKAESYYPSVAVSSMIARYSFIKYLEELGNKYDVVIPKGASGKVNEFALELKEKIGLEEITKLVKKNFKNYQNLL